MTKSACPLTPRLFPFAIGLLASCLFIFAALTAYADTTDELSPGLGPRHAIAMHGDPALPPDFMKLPFTSDRAIKGGEITVTPQASGGDVPFDSLNPFIIKGNAYWDIRNITFESLMARNPDEPFTLYGLLAETIEVPEDRSWVSFTLRPEAAFSDGTPVTVEDVVFSMETLRDKGLPNMGRFYSKIVRTDKLNARTVRFVFENTGDREAPLLMGLMPILSQTYYSEHDFEKSALEPPLGTGPYVVVDVDAGRSITFQRNERYWGRDLPINANRNNFDRIKLEFYRDKNSEFEAFKKGLLHYRMEGDPTRWASGYDFAAARNALILRDEFEHGRPSGMLGLVFNTRRPIFNNPDVRRALTLPFDFEWVNSNFYHDSFERTQSFFDNSELAAAGPASFAEQELLATVGAELDPQFIAQGWSAPINGSRDAARNNARAALDLMKSAGWVIRDKRMVHQETGEPFVFEILLNNRTFERLALNYAASLKRIGIDVEVRVVDGAQYQHRLQTYDFDMVPFRWGGSLSPGNEQAYRWGSREADVEGTYNLAGVKSVAVDALVEAIASAATREELVTAVRALDRVLLSGSYAVPLYYQKVDRMAWWGELQHPEQVPLLGWAYGGAGFRLNAWWMSSDN